MPSRRDLSAQIQYHGEAGTTKQCVDAIVRLIQFGDRITNAALLSSGKSHCFLLTVNCGDRIAIKAGFSSGYMGTGPSGLASALQLLERHGAEIEEYLVPESIIEAINSSSLRLAQLREIEGLSPRRPIQWFDYVYAVKGDQAIDRDDGLLNNNFPSILPYAILDPRIVDLALSLGDHPDASLVSAYRRLEDIVREKADLGAESSTRLFAKAFQGDDPVLYWDGVDPSEGKARASLFDAIYRAYRNPRAHREPSNSSHVDTREFLLVNELYLLESSSKRRS